MRFEALVPMLQTNDISRTRQWYETVLGFRCVSARGKEWCRLARDAVALMFMHNDHLGDPHAMATQYIYVDDALAPWSSIKDRCSTEWGPEKTSYGLIEFAIKDPNGYLLSFGHPAIMRISEPTKQCSSPGRTCAASP
jgi:catechol 2,3-dioxygenase-like lactoylglutathione lyase family enzyme